MVWKQAEGVSEEEAQRRWDEAFDILFSKVDKEQKRRFLLPNLTRKIGSITQERVIR